MVGGPADVTSSSNFPGEGETATTKAQTATETTTSSADSLSTTSPSSSVHVDFYGESLCPDCQHMVMDVLDPLFSNGISQLFSLRYIAYGNVRGDPASGDVSCQHGAKECKYNRYINCAQKLLNHDQNKWFPYVYCLAENMGSIEKAADSCAEKAGLVAENVSSCAEGKDGADLEREAGEETNALIPKHNFVPWVVVNGVALGGAFEDLGRYVCAAANAQSRPEACSELPDNLKFMRRP